jgi:hypothetical protein
MVDSDKARRLVILKILKAHHETTADKIGAEVNKLSEELYDQFEDDGLSELCLSATMINPQTKEEKAIFPDSRDRIISPEIKYRPTVKDEPNFFLWVRQNNHGALIKETIHPASLASWVEKQKTENKPLPDITLLSIFDQKTISVTKGKAPK